MCIRDRFIDEECNSAITVDYVNLFFNMVWCNSQDRKRLLENGKQVATQQQQQYLIVNNKVEEEASITLFKNQTMTEEIKSNTSMNTCLLYTSPSPRDRQKSRMPSSA
eukprot:TRINITY_DN1543_c0_g1_i1.p2 TRINITY_DN1543_c0_g1~~TRINITY_DN1543_c0_g1_i1.p2  ORF type:complete len:117 (+),score=29.53 TRINITY_DN1543_c0_g1_i1:30-353(+)